MRTQRDSLTPGLRIVRNAFYLAISDVAVRALTSIVSILVARYLGPENYGLLSVALALSGIAGYLTDLGVTPVMIREGTKPNAPIGKILYSTLRLRLLFAAGTTLVMVLVAWFYYPITLARLVILVVVLPNIWAGVFRGLSAGYFQMVQEMLYMALINAVSSLAGAGVFLLGVIFHWPLPFLALGYGLSAVTGAILGMGLIKHHVQIEKDWFPGITQGLLAFTLGGGFGLLLPQLGPLILPHVAGLEETGFFSAAYRIPGVLLIIPGVIATAFYPQLFAYAHEDRSRYLTLTLREIRFMGTACLVMAVPLALHARGMVGFLFGQEWVDRAGGALIGLCGVLALAGLSWPLADSLTTQGLQRRRTVVTGALVVLGALAYWLGGRTQGALGGALAALVVEIGAVTGFLLYNSLRKELFFRGLMPWALKVVLMVPLAWGCKLLFGSGVWVLGLEAVLIAALVLLIDKELRRETKILVTSMGKVFFRSPFGLHNF